MPAAQDVDESLDGVLRADGAHDRGEHRRQHDGVTEYAPPHIASEEANRSLGRIRGRVLGIGLFLADRCRPTGRKKVSIFVSIR